MSTSRMLFMPLLLCLPGAGFAADGDAASGKRMWMEARSVTESAETRSCATCHTDHLQGAGKHAKTGKLIEPMAPSVNPSRLSDAAKVEKWFLRNCKWTLGRECNAAEKADFLAFIRSQ